jgi:hypothetical protein
MPVSRNTWVLFVVWSVTALLCGSVAVFAQDKPRKLMKGEVEEKVAFVQTFDPRIRGAVCEIEAKVKFIKAGTYVVAAGFHKEEFFHESLTGTKYFETKTVKADAGDVITLKFKCRLAPRNRKTTVGVFLKEKDIPTKS